MELAAHDVVTLSEDVNIVFHCAGNVRFNDSLKNAVNNNTVGTLRVLNLATKFRNLVVFSHMSTVGCHSYKFELDEKYYPSRLDAFDVIQKTRQLSDESLKEFEKKL